MSQMDYHKGLEDLGSGCHAWMQPDGSWGWSNAGLITSGGESVLVDTLFDVSLTREMLTGLGGVTDQHPIKAVINTHSDGDHYFGNELIAELGADIIATEAAAAHMNQAAVDALQALKREDGAAGEFARDAFGPFDFAGVTSTGPTRTFEGSLTLNVGDRAVEVIQVGPAHTPGDALVHVPDAGILYAGDILFVGGTPIVWAGPVENWISACELILDMPVKTIVPGHGPVTDKSGVEVVKAYLEFVKEESTKRFEQGLSPDEAIDSIELGPWAEVPEYGRIAQNVLRVYQSLDTTIPVRERLTVIEKIARLEGYQGS